MMFNKKKNENNKIVEPLENNQLEVKEQIPNESTEEQVTDNPIESFQEVSQPIGEQPVVDCSTLEKQKVSQPIEEQCDSNKEENNNNIVGVESKIENGEIISQETKENEEDGTIEIKTVISTKNYDDTVVKLINEVKMFNDEVDEIVTEKKKKIWPFILILLLVLVIGIGVFIFLNMESETKPKEENKEEKTNKDITYSFEETEDGISFFAGEELIGIYKCVECEVLSGSQEYFSSKDKVIAITDDDNIFLYDFEKQEAISENYQTFKLLKNGEKIVAFVVSDDKGMYGIIDTSGKVIVPLKYEEIGFTNKEGIITDYDYAKDRITAKLDGYWGVISFSDEEIIPFKYDDIYYNGYEAFVAYTEGLWYLIDFNDKILIKKGYDIMIPIKSYVFASSEDIFYILNYSGESIINQAVPTYLNDFRNRDIDKVPAFTIEEDGTKVNIYINKSDGTYNQYKFNTVNGELTEIIQ